MKTIAIAFAATMLFAVSAPTESQAQTYPWCAVYGGGAGGGGNSGTNCGFSTLQQCQETVSGIGGVCERNPRYASRAPATRR